MWLTKIETAMKRGLCIELLDYFTKKCPKQNETRLLKPTNADGQIFLMMGNCSRTRIG